MALHDPKAFREFFDRTFHPAYRFAFALSGDAEEAEEATAALYADAWLTWRRMPRGAEEVPEILDDIFARSYERFQGRYRLIGNADEIARMMAGEIHRRWEQTSGDFRRGPNEARDSRLKLLGPEAPPDENDDGSEGDASAAANSETADLVPSGGRGEMANWRRVRW